MCTGAFPLACIYHRLSHKCQAPRFFAGVETLQRVSKSAEVGPWLFKEAHDEAVHKNSYKRKFYELISASLACTYKGRPVVG